MLKEQDEYIFKLSWPQYYRELEEICYADVDLVRFKLKDGCIGYYHTNDTWSNIVHYPHFSFEESWKRAFRILLKHRMEYKFMTQNELAEVTGISQSMISGYLTGDRTPSATNIAKIAKAVGVLPGYFTGCMMDIL